MCRWQLLIWMGATLSSLAEAGPKRSAWAMVTPGSSKLVIQDGEPTFTVSSKGVPQGAVAWATFEDDIYENGWSYLQIESNPYVDDEQQAYAAGALEAYLTRELMENQWANLFVPYCINQDDYCGRVNDFLTRNLAHTREQQHKFKGSDAFWNVVHLMMRQLSGLNDVFENETLDFTHELETVTRVLISSAMGDLFDLEGVLQRVWDTNSLSQIVSCSALVKIVGDYEDIYIAHDAWFLYRGMLRVQKRYIFPWHRTAHLTGIEDIIPGHTITMSSYAGNLVSWDNFYLSSTGLAITETSLVNRNLDLWDTVVPESGALTWIRSAIATRLAVTGKEWVDIITRDNSGTCNNQILVLDYKLFTPGKPIVDNTLWLYEQIPAYTRQKDISQELREKTYWASYNIPYFPDIMTISNQLPVVEQYGDFYTFENCPRAKIFRRDHVKVKDMNSMLKLMRYNDFMNDPLSICNCTPPYNPTYAIAARFDLFDPQGTYDMPGMYRHAVGGIDAKVTNYNLFSSLDLVGVSGPTWDDQPPFQWSTSGFADGHVGQPDRWQFDPAQYKWAEPRLQWR